MHSYPPYNKRSAFSAVSLDEYIYIFDTNQSVLKLEYGDVSATWRKVNNWNNRRGRHGECPVVVASSNAIFLVGAGYRSDTPVAKRSVSKYSPSWNQWSKMKPKPTATSTSTLVCTKDFLYCIGGKDDAYEATDIVERMDLTTTKWRRIASMKQPQHDISADECKGNIYVFGYEFMKVTLEIYDPQTD